ncbi:MAG TPA: sigma-70 family RNA polymerase sigma factor [Gemmataceae bacterium]|nr:sigma-70 family RNA polymerase sigma factor [Gemmataceae bacterium]
MMPNAQADLILEHIRRLVAEQGQTQLPDQQLLHRFISQGDEVAFAALVRRHGPMVLQVCRRVLPNLHDAEDAFQATFLLLARKARSIRKPESVSCWLHGVAHRVSLRANASVCRKLAGLPDSQNRAPTDPAEEVTWHELRTLVDQELQQLPEKYRAPLLLCYLEGQTRDEAAHQLGCPLGTLKSRLERGRELLRNRLLRRGLTLSAALLPIGLSSTASSAAVPKLLVHSTARAALKLSAGTTAASELVSAQVAALVDGGLQTIFATKLKIVVALFLSLSLAAGAGVLTRGTLIAQAAAPLQPTEATSSTAAANNLALSADPKLDAKDVLVVRSRVVDAGGKPVAGAKLYLLDAATKTMPPPIRATSAADGGFHFMVPKADVHLTHYFANPWAQVAVLAVAEGYGPAWRPAVAAEETGEQVLRLAKDDVPIQGRVLDLQGKPIAGVRIQVEDLSTPLAADLTPWLEAVRNEKDDGYPLENKFLTGLRNSGLAQLFPAVTTDADGRFQLKGIGRERVAGIRIEGPTIEMQQVRVMTRSGERMKVLAFRRNPRGYVLTYYGATFEHYAAPTKPIVGVVRDKDIGKPLAGVTIRSDKWAGTNVSGDGQLQTVTDQDGRYRLVGMPKGEGNTILAVPAEGQPYLLSVQAVGDSPGLEPITVDFPLKRGVLIRGRVTDRVTGRGVPANIEYVAFAENPFRNQVPNWETNHYLYTQDDGSFEVVAMPGRGLLAARAWRDQYLLEVGAEEIKGRDEQGFYPTAPHLVHPSTFHTLVEINPPKDADTLTCNLIVDPGKTMTGKVLGPDGKPLRGARAFGLQSYGLGSWTTYALDTPDFTVYGLRLGQPRRVMFAHEERKLAGSVLIRGDERDPVTVSLEPWGTVTGRLVTADGSPRSKVELWFGTDLRSDRTRGIPHQQVSRPDKDGQFRIEGLVPGLRHTMMASEGYIGIGTVFQDLILKSGETKDLGDVEAK